MQDPPRIDYVAEYCIINFVYFIYKQNIELLQYKQLRTSRRVATVALRSSLLQRLFIENVVVYKCDVIYSSGDSGTFLSFYKTMLLNGL